jgi:hypothetical protein
MGKENLSYQMESYLLDFSVKIEYLDKEDIID